MIRPATDRDYPAIRQIIRHAFGQDDEANLVERLRADGDALVELVSATDIALQGHILYSPLKSNATARFCQRRHWRPFPSFRPSNEPDMARR